MPDETKKPEKVTFDDLLRALQEVEAELAEVTEDRDGLLVELTGSCDGPGLREENARLRVELRNARRILEQQRGELETLGENE